MTDRICLVANSSSDRNSRGDTAFAVAMAVFGGGAALRRCAPGSGIARRVRGVLADGFGAIVAAGRDGTVVAVAQSLIGTPVRMGMIAAACRPMMAVWQRRMSWAPSAARSSPSPAGPAGAPL
ncbi:MAG: hypothetical protein ACOY4T_04570, partial [Pseudomonadota bacterium]